MNDLMAYVNNREHKTANAKPRTQNRETQNRDTQNIEEQRRDLLKETTLNLNGPTLA